MAFSSIAEPPKRCKICSVEKTMFNNLKNKVMQFNGALIKEQGVSFAIVVVKPSVLEISTRTEETRQGFSSYFPGVPIVLMAQNNSGTPTFSGRRDIVKFLANINPSRIPFKRYSVN